MRRTRHEAPRLDLPGADDPELGLLVLDRALGLIRDNVIVYGPDGLILYANQTLARKWGVDRRDIVGRYVRDFVTVPETLAEFERLLAEAVQFGRRASHTFRVDYSELGVRDMAVTLTPYFEDDSTRVRFVVSVAIDVTDAGVPAVPPPKLPQRRREVVTLVARGYANQAIAQELGISVRTVEKHRRDAAASLGLEGRADFFAYAKRHGLL